MSLKGFGCSCVCLFLLLCLPLRKVPLAFVVKLVWWAIGTIRVVLRSGRFDWLKLYSNRWVMRREDFDWLNIKSSKELIGSGFSLPLLRLRLIGQVRCGRLWLVDVNGRGCGAIGQC